jgi:hypothetical protein
MFEHIQTRTVKLIRLLLSYSVISTMVGIVIVAVFRWASMCTPRTVLGTLLCLVLHGAVVGWALTRALLVALLNVCPLRVPVPSMFFLRVVLIRKEPTDIHEVCGPSFFGQ